MEEDLSKHRVAAGKEVLDADTDISAKFVIAAVDVVLGKAVVIQADAGRCIRMPDSVLPVVDDVAVKGERFDASGERSPGDVAPGLAELNADRDAPREIALPLCGKIESAVHVGV